MKLRRVIASLCLSSIMVSGLLPCASAYTEQQNTMAKELYDLGLFKGNGIDKNYRPILTLIKRPPEMKQSQCLCVF